MEHDVHQHWVRCNLPSTLQPPVLHSEESHQRLLQLRTSTFAHGARCCNFLTEDVSCDPDCPEQPHFSPKWGKMAEKSISAPPAKREKHGRKMGKLASFTHFWANFPLFGHFSPIFPVGPESIFRPCFSHFGPEAKT